MPRRISSVHDMGIDEVSLVDVPANQHAAVMIQKNYQEADMPDAPEGPFFNEDGLQLPDDHQFEVGETFFTEDGEGYVMEAEPADERELVGAGVGDGGAGELGKSAFFRGSAPAAPSDFSKSLAAQLRESLSKSAAGTETRELMSKAAEAIEQADQRAIRAEEIAKSERRVRLTREFTEVAKNYNVPADPTELGGVLMRMAESMDDADCAVIHKALTSAGAIILEEIGITGGGTEDGSDPMAEAEKYAAEQIAKSSGGATALSKAAGMTQFYVDNPGAYDEYVARQNAR